MAAGAWTLKLSPDTPQRIVDQIDYFSHVAVTQAPEDIRLAGDAALSTALYVGVLRGTSKDADGTELSGAGMAIWLGDEDDKGAVYETPQTFTGATFTATIAALLSGTAIHAGTISSVTGTYTGSHQYQTPRKAIDYVCSTMGAEWRVNGDGTLDAGLVSALYPTSPRAGIFAKSRGTGSSIRGLRGAARLASDVQDFTTRVVLLANGTEAAVALGDADIGVNPYVDLFGNPVKMTRLVSESTTSSGNADVRAQLQLNRFTSPRDAVTLNSTTHDVAGSLAVGEYVWVYDPDAGLYDNNNEVQWQGETLNAALLRVTSLTWPVEDGRGVYLRTAAGTWLDLTPYVRFESGQTTVTVGGYNRSLVSTGAESVAQRTPTIQPDLSVPNAPTWTTPFVQSVYQSPQSGTTRAQVFLTWTLPTNTDGSPVIDGDHFEIRYRTTSAAILPATHAQMAGYTHAQLAVQTHGTPLPFTTGTWDTRVVGWDTLSSMVSELTPGTPYEFQIRAVDNANPPNFSVWSASTLFQTIVDSIPPATPAAAVVAGNRTAIEVRHDLGRASGGTFNLDADLSHLEVHAEYEPTFTPIASSPAAGGTMLGKLRATWAELTGSIPVVASFNVENTAPLYVKVVAVDLAGNRSGPSTAAQVTALLIDSAHISDLTASKITAGTVTSSILNGGLFHTNATGVGSDVGFDGLGFFALDQNGDPYFTVDDGGTYVRGNIEAGVHNGRRIELEPTVPLINFWLDTTPQRYVIEPYTINQPGDPANTPGVQLYGRNTAGQLEGCRTVFYEDGYFVQIMNAGGTTNTGGQILADRNFGWVGYVNTSNANGEGWKFQAQANAFYVLSNKTNNEGGHIQGTSAAVWTAVLDSTGTFKTYTLVDGTNQWIHFYPSGNGHGRLVILNDNGGPNGNTARLQFVTGGNFGNILKVFDTGSTVQFECRNVSDSGFAPLVVSSLTQTSDAGGKKDIADANLSALEKIKGVKPRKYKRKGGGRAKLDAPEETPDGPEEIGLLAHEVPPEMYRQTSEGGGIDLYSMATYLWASVQELATENEDLRSRVAALEAAVDKLTKKVTP